MNSDIPTRSFSGRGQPMQHGTLVTDRYRIEALIGQGGMGTVFSARDVRTEQTVAIKQLKAEPLAADPALLERFAREGEALRQLNHPNIVKLLDVIHESSGHYLVMEYVGGGSLAQALGSTARMAVARGLDIGLDLADALIRAHHLKIVHRDLKPANVLLADDGSPRLSDFGIARADRDKRITTTGALMGTPEYLSPELLNGEEIDTRADLWAFGVMLFE